MAIEKHNLKIAGLIEEWLVRKLKGSELQQKAAPDVPGHVGSCRSRNRESSSSAASTTILSIRRYMSKQMYVRYQIPAGDGAPCAGVPGGDGPRGRTAGDHLHRHPRRSIGLGRLLPEGGWPVYTVDQPGRGKSIYVDSAYGPQGATEHCESGESVHGAWTDGPFPQAYVAHAMARNRVHGDSVFDQFFASQYGGMDALPQEQLTARAARSLC